MPRPAKRIGNVYEKNRGNGLWYVRYRVDGKLVRKAIGSKQQALDYLDTLREQRRVGSLPLTATETILTNEQMRRAETQGILLGHLCDGLLAHIKKNPSEYKDQKNPPQRIAAIKDAFGQRQAESIKPSEIADWLDSMDLAPATKNRYKAMISAVFTFGKERDEIKVNPARDVKQKRVNNGVIRYLLPEEEKRLRAVLQSDVDACGPQNQRLRKHMLHRIYELDVALGTGMRKGEQYNLTWPDIHFSQGELIARDTKNGTDRKVYMIDNVAKALKGIKALSLTRKRSGGNLHCGEQRSKISDGTIYATRSVPG
jgi:integrase